MINKNILQDKLVDKFMNSALNSIVSECFIGGLPIDSKYLDSDECDKLKSYMTSVLESLGGVSLIDSALENASLSEPQRELLLKVYYICNESAVDAANRVVKETDCKKENNVNDVVDGSQFTEEEYSDFIKKAGNLELDEIASIIQEKTKQALIDERNAYEKEEQLEEDLKNELASTKDFANESVNSYLDIILEKDAPRHYISLFSKMQYRAMEAISRMKDITDKYSYIDALNDFTFESFLPELRKSKSVIEALESVVNLQELLNNKSGIATESTDGLHQNKVKMATLVSTVAYTALETLKTLNLYSPSKDTIKRYVGSYSISLESVLESEVCDVLEKTDAAVNDVVTADYAKYTVDELTVIVDRLTRIKELLEIITLNNADFLNSRTEVLNSLSNTLIKISKIIAQYQLNDEDEDNSYYGKLKKDNDIAQLNKIDTLFSKNPNVSEILINIDPTSSETVIGVTAINNSRKVVGTSYITLSNKADDSKIIEYVKNIFGESKLANSPKNVTIYVSDGSAKKIALK